MPIIILQALKYWKWIGVGLLVLALAFQTVRYERQKAATARSETALANQVSEYRAVAHKAVVAMWAAKQAKEESDRKVITKEVKVYVEKRTPALAAVSDRMRWPTGTDPSSSRENCLSTIPALSTGTMRPGDAALVDGKDAAASTDNTLRLEGIISAWKGVSELQEPELSDIY